MRARESWAARPQEWEGARSTPCLGPGAVHVWRVDLEAAARAQTLESSLSTAERDRAGRYRFAGDRRRFIAARGALRGLLSGYLETPPSAVRFVYGPRGRPELPRSANPLHLQFNLSHSGTLALVAVTLGRAIGVDLEAIRRDVQCRSLAERFFSPAETAVLAALPAADQAPAFFRCWTRKEAYVKARGDGISLGLDTFEVTLAATEPPALRRCATAGDAAARWELVHLEPAPGYVGALAVEGAISQLRRLALCW